MFRNKTKNGKLNICGKRIANYRKALGVSQRELSEIMQLVNLDLDKNSIQRVESGQRFVTDIELVAFSRAFCVPIDDLLDTNELIPLKTPEERKAEEDALKKEQKSIET